MRRDLLFTALVFTAIGFLGGYVYFRETVERPLRSAARPAAPATTQSQELPEGHPPLDISERWRELEARARGNPDDAQAALDLANFLYDVQNWEEAITWYERALALRPRDANARTDMATAYFNLGGHEEAIAAYDRVLEIEPNKPQALYGLALARLHGQQDRAGARRAFEQLRRAHPDFPGVALLEEALRQGDARP
jgi:tetratricopeptide (TPR) repeat protein